MMKLKFVNVCVIIFVTFECVKLLYIFNKLKK